ncbi:MAG: NuoM family protein [Candidatus Margulisiibacteriota bacterium]
MMALLTLTLPFLGALVCALLPPAWSRWLALVASVGTALCLKLMLKHPEAIPHSLGHDPLTTTLLIITALFIPFIIVGTWSKAYSKGVYASLLATEGALIGLFCAQNALIFYTFWELALLPSIYMTYTASTSDKVKSITWRFLLYSLAGGLAMLTGFLYLGAAHDTFNIAALCSLSLPLATSKWIFVALFAAFAVKTPLIPFHGWQPDTYEASPYPATLVLAVLLSKMGIYGLLRFYPLLHPVIVAWHPYLLALGTLGCLYAAFLAFTQTSLKRFIAYSSISHLSMIVLGIFSTTSDGIYGATFQVVSHCVTTFGLFLAAFILSHRRGSEDLADFGGVASQAPLFAGLFLVVVMASVALPFTSGFIGEFLILKGLFHMNPFIASAAGLTLILGAAYMLKLNQSLFYGKNDSNTLYALLPQERLLLSLTAVAAVVLGLYPTPLLNFLGHFISTLGGLQ